MVGEYHDPPVVALLLESFEDRRDDVLVDLLERANFVGDVGIVARFVGRFNMDEYEVVRVEGFDGSLSFSDIVRVVVARRAFDLDEVPAYEFREASQQIDCGDRSPFFPEPLGEIWQRGSLALPPQPNVGGRVFAQVGPDGVDVAFSQHVVGFAHQREKDFRALATGQVGRNRLPQNVVGRDGFRVHLAGDHEQVPIAHAQIHLHARVGEGRLQRFDDRGSFRGRDVARAVVFHDVVDDRHEIAAENPVAVRDGNVVGSSFQRRSTCVKLFRRIPQQRKRRYVRPGREPLGNIRHRANAAFLGNGVHVRNVGSLQWRQAIQLREWKVGSTVGNDNRIFHNDSVE